MFDTDEKESGAVIVGRKDWTPGSTTDRMLLSNDYVSKLGEQKIEANNKNVKITFWFQLANILASFFFLPPF